MSGPEGRPTEAAEAAVTVTGTRTVSETATETATVAATETETAAGAGTEIAHSGASETLPNERAHANSASEVWLFTVALGVALAAFGIAACAFSGVDNGEKGQVLCLPSNLILLPLEIGLPFLFLGALTVIAAVVCGTLERPIPGAAAGLLGAVACVAGLWLGLVFHGISWPMAPLANVSWVERLSWASGPLVTIGMGFLIVGAARFVVAPEVGRP